MPDGKSLATTPRITIDCDDGPIGVPHQPRISAYMPYVDPHDGHWEGPILAANQQKCSVAALGIHRNGLFLVCQRGKCSGPLPILRVFARKDNIVVNRPENIFN
jgi:hypothetical protein